MSLLKESMKATLRLYTAFVSELFNSESKKENLKENLIEMKDYYKKGIERKVGLELGEINLNLSSEKALKFSYDYAINDLKKAEEKNLPWEEQKKILNQNSANLGMYYLISKPFFNLIYSVANATWDERSKEITFSDGYVSRISKKVFQNSDDGTMIHELSHALWSKISENDDCSIKNYKDWSEGFAEYGRKNYFRDLILPGSTINKTIGSAYVNGYKKVKKIIEKKGIESYLEIPNKWQEFEKELRSENK